MSRRPHDLSAARYGLDVVAKRLAKEPGFEAEHALVRLAIGDLERLVRQTTKRLSDKQSDKTKTLVGQARSATRLLHSESPLRSANLSDSDDLDPDAAADAGEGYGLVGQPDDGLSDKRKGQARFRARLAGHWDGVGGVSTSGSMLARIGEVVPQLELLARERKADPEALFGAACRRFKADPVTKAKRYGLRVLLSQLEQWVDDDSPLPPPGNAAPAVIRPASRLLNPPPVKDAS